MFVGFIAVVVILLVIVGLMSSGGTNGSGGVDQTKATKALSEISALVQSTGFYKTTTTDSDYAGVTVAELIAAGIVSTSDIREVGTDVNGYGSIPTASVADQAGTVLADGTLVILSRSVNGLFYEVVAGTTANSFTFNIVAPVDAAALTSGVKLALEKAYAKLDSTTVNGIVDGVAGDGASAMEFN